MINFQCGGRASTIELTHCHLCPTRYSFTPESIEAYEGKVPCPGTQHRNNVPILRGGGGLWLGVVRVKVFTNNCTLMYSCDEIRPANQYN